MSWSGRTDVTIATLRRRVRETRVLSVQRTAEHADNPESESHRCVAQGAALRYAYALADLADRRLGV